MRSLLFLVLSLSVLVGASPERAPVPPQAPPSFDERAPFLLDMQDAEEDQGDGIPLPLGDGPSAFEPADVPRVHVKVHVDPTLKSRRLFGGQGTEDSPYLIAVPAGSSEDRRCQECRTNSLTVPLRDDQSRAWAEAVRKASESLAEVPREAVKPTNGLVLSTDQPTTVEVQVQRPPASKVPAPAAVPSPQQPAPTYPAATYYPTRAYTYPAYQAAPVYTTYQPATAYYTVPAYSATPYYGYTYDTGSSCANGSCGTQSRGLFGFFRRR
jgi:hypothetical protein